MTEQSNRPDSRIHSRARFSSGWLIPVLVALSAASGCSSPSEAVSVDRNVALQDRSELETDVLADGEVLYAELEKAALHMVGCIEDALGVEGTASYRGDSFSFDFYDPQKQMNEKMEQFGLDVEECEAEIDEIQFAWADQLASVGHGADQYEVVVECLRRDGLEVASDSPEDLSNASSRYPEQYQACLSEAFPGLDE